MVADLSAAAVIGDYGVKIAGGYTEEESRSAKTLKIGWTVVVRLCQYGNSIAMTFQQTGNNRHTEGRVINVGIAGDKDNIDTVPTACAAFLQGCRKMSC